MRTLDLHEEALELWAQCPAELTPAKGGVDPEARRAHEAGLERFLSVLEAEVRALPKTRGERLRAHGRITEAFTHFGREVLGLDDSQLALLLDGGLSSVGTRLARRARQFDPKVSLADILQATRNAWTACGLQRLFGRPMGLTPSIFAYSMLYPYTDNYLDDSGVALEAKRAFSASFGRRLAGEMVPAANRHEEHIWGLVSLIESEYARPENPGVFESLLDIHRAQFRSLRLRKGMNGAETLPVVFEKGGTSVLADAWLAAGRLDEQQMRFSYLWGVVLQMGDDLQDLEEDLASGVTTAFSARAGVEPLDALTARTLQFTLRVMSCLPAGARDGALGRLIRRSSLSLIVRSAGAAARYHTPEFAARLEAQSPFGSGFLDAQRELMQRHRVGLARLFEAFLAGDEDEPAFPHLPGWISGSVAGTRPGGAAIAARD